MEVYIVGSEQLTYVDGIPYDLVVLGILWKLNLIVEELFYLFPASHHQGGHKETDYQTS
jgi:hypothetical protein